MVQEFLLHKNNIYSENPKAVGGSGVKLQVIKEIQFPTTWPYMVKIKGF